MSVDALSKIIEYAKNTGSNAGVREVNQIGRNNRTRFDAAIFVLSTQGVVLENDPIGTPP
jgi:hypothetical protein